MFGCEYGSVSHAVYIRTLNPKHAIQRKLPKPGGPPQHLRARGCTYWYVCVYGCASKSATARGISKHSTGAEPLYLACEASKCRSSSSVLVGSNHGGSVATALEKGADIYDMVQQVTMLYVTVLILVQFSFLFAEFCLSASLSFIFSSMLASFSFLFPLNFTRATCPQQPSVCKACRSLTFSF